MNKTLLECPECKKSGGIQMLPWATSAGVFGAVSLLCDHCGVFMILKLDCAKEVIFKEEE